MSAETTVATTLKLVEITDLDPAAIRTEEALGKGERILHLTPDVRAYLQTIGPDCDLEAVEKLLACLSRIRTDILAHWQNTAVAS